MTAETPHNQALDGKSGINPEGAGQQLSSLALQAVGPFAQSFHGAEEHFLGRTPDGEHRLIATTIGDDGQKIRETLGSGQTQEAALRATLAGMRSLETVRTPAILRLPMTDEASVDFSALEHYAPKIAPGLETRAIPSYLTEVLSDSQTDKQTYETTIAEEDWDKKLFTQLESYLTAGQRGIELIKTLKITSLEVLTPEQAVKLSLGIVQELSQYSWNDTNAPRQPSHADQSTTMSLLQEGIERKGDPEWEGNGVCRNVAANVKAVFEALKSGQGELSMLRNTYAVYNSSRGEGYDDKREDYSHMSATPQPGHAWNTFVTVDATGSANIAIVDATWALESEAAAALEHMDYTVSRMAVMARKLFTVSEQKPEAFHWLSDYYRQMIRQGYAEEGSQKQQGGGQKRQFAFTEYMKAAAAVLPELGLDQHAPIVPPGITATAFQLKDKLDPSEVRTLFTMSEAGWIDNFPTILGAYVSSDTNKLRSGNHKIEALVEKNDGLQQAILEALGEDQSREFAERNSGFRIRLRELQPHLLPGFDPSKSAADKRELEYLAKSNTVLGFSPESMVRYAHKRLRAIAGDDRLYETVTYGRTDYDLIKNFRELSKLLQGLSAEKS